MGGPPESGCCGPSGGCAVRTASGAGPNVRNLQIRPVRQGQAAAQRRAKAPWVLAQNHALRCCAPTASPPPAALWGPSGAASAPESTISHAMCHESAEQPYQSMLQYDPTLGCMILWLQVQSLTNGQANQKTERVCNG